MMHYERGNFFSDVILIGGKTNDVFLWSKFRHGSRPLLMHETFLYPTIFALRDNFSPLYILFTDKRGRQIKSVICNVR